VVGKPSLHCGRDAERLMYATKVEKGHVEGDGSLEMVKALAESQAQPGETPKVCPHTEIGAFDVRCADSFNPRMGEAFSIYSLFPLLQKCPKCPFGQPSIYHPLHFRNPQISITNPSDFPAAFKPVQDSVHRNQKVFRRTCSGVSGSLKGISNFGRGYSLRSTLQKVANSICVAFRGSLKFGCSLGSVSFFGSVASFDNLKQSFHSAFEFFFFLAQLVKLLFGSGSNGLRIHAWRLS